MKRAIFGALSFAALASGMAPPVAARPLVPAENRYLPWSGGLPVCNDPGVLSSISSRFAQRESDYWQSGLQIVGFDRIRETGYRTNGVDYIPRRYCSANVLVNDQKMRPVVYSVGEDLGFAGGDPITFLQRAFGNNTSTSSNYGIDWCVVGLDRNYAYAQNCRAARP